MKKIIIAQGDRIIERQTDETSLMKLLQDEGIKTAFPCNGNGSCGKCQVQATGVLSVPSSQEILLLPSKNSDNIRLACQVTLEGDAIITVPENQQKSKVLLENGTNTLIYDGDSADKYGIAVDIGTTTVVSYLYHLPTGRLCNAVGEMNDQYRYGADVIARIEHSNKNGKEILHKATTAQLELMFEDNTRQENISMEQIHQLVITGNTTMLHFLTNKNPRGIGASPFIPESLFGYSLSAAELFPLLNETATLYLPPCISAYVGADITCGIASTNLLNHEENSLLIDIGTNGEMVLLTQGKLVSCATAAGPAFEGREIQMGMPAAPGAINHVYLKDGAICYTTIDNKKPIGLCGTGIISVIHVMLQIGALEETGSIAEEGHDFLNLLTEKNDQPAFFIGDSGVFITQQDIRNIQLAKAAIAAGIGTMLNSLSLTPADIKKAYLAGGFGNYIVPAEAVGIGLLPAGLLPSLEVAGNSAGGGAAQLLFSKEKRTHLEEVTKEIVDLELSSNPYFMEEYMEQMMFPS